MLLEVVKDTMKNFGKREGEFLRPGLNVAFHVCRI